jgi:hypothetical protein
MEGEKGHPNPFQTTITPKSRKKKEKETGSPEQLETHIRWYISILIYSHRGPIREKKKIKIKIKIKNLPL